jgi:hypothetical protein
MWSNCINKRKERIKIGKNTNRLYKKLIFKLKDNVYCQLLILIFIYSTKTNIYVNGHESFKDVNS